MIKGSLFKFIFLIFISSQNIIGQKTILEEADSLFENKDYQNAKILYDSLFFNYEFYNKNVLIKLSFIEDELGNYEKSIFFLKILNQSINDEKIENILNEIITENKLETHKNSDSKEFILLFSKYKLDLVSILFSILIIIFIINIYSVIKKIDLKFIYPFIITALIILLILNVDFNKEGIIRNDNVFIMNEPSSGSDVHSVIDKGERVDIIGEGELWYEIEFRDQIKFIRKKNLLVIDQ